MADLQSVGIGKSHQWCVIRPGLSVPTEVNRQTARQLLDIPEGKTVLAWIGRFTGIKNPLFAVQVIEHLPRVVRDQVVLVMAGAGELLEECKQYASKQELPIIFTGWITDINPVLGAADLLFMTSKNEGMPVVIVEAALRGIPTITTDVGGVKEFVSDGQTGWLVEQSIFDISSQITKLIYSPQLNSVGKSAKHLAETEFSIENMTNSHIYLYKKMIENA
jgi:glycosyltransferase involved in cell wall biosynthesis